MTKPGQTMFQRSSLGILGGVLIIAAAFISNSTLEHWLVSDPTRSLSWGSTLFRLLLAGHGLLLMFAAMVWARFQSSRVAETDSNDAHSSVSKDRAWPVWTILIILSVVALGLRLWRLNTDLWFDELLTLLNFVRLPLGDILTSLPDQNNHILFSVLSYASVHIFGESAWAVRLPSVLFGVMSLWALFLLGRRVIGAREALLACGLMTFSYHHIWFSQNARGYMALLFFSLLTTWLWLEAKDRKSMGWWVGYAFAATAGMLSHMTMAFVVAAHVVTHAGVVALDWKKNRTAGKTFSDLLRNLDWKPILAWVLCVTITLQFYALALPEFLRVGLHEVSLESEWTNPWWVVTETLRNLTFGFSGAVVLLVGGLMVGFGWLNMARRDWRVGALMLLPGLLSGSIMLALGHNLWPRFFFFSFGFVILSAVHGSITVPRLIIERLGTWPRQQYAREKLGAEVGVGVACLIIAASAVTVPRNYAYPKQDYTGARDYVEMHRVPNDAVVAVGLAGVAYGRYFAPAWSTAQTEAELDVARYGKTDVWLVYTLPVEVKAYRPEVWRVIQSDFEVVKIFPGTLSGGEVFICRQKSKAAPQQLTAGL